MKYLITSALPYANGPLHIGHLAGAYLPADIFTRFLKKKGIYAIHICGTDENGVPITITAEKEGITPKDVVDKYHKLIKEQFDSVHIQFDNFSRTTTEIHRKLSQDFFLKILKNGYIEKRETEQFYCERCKRFLPDRYIEGICPFCKEDGARGDQCEKCGRWLEPTLLIQPRCKICGSTPVIKKTFHWYLRLDLFQKKLEEWVKTKKWKENVITAVYKWLNEGLKPRAITRDIDWGVPVPLDEAKGKVLYVWFDAPIGYISSTIEYSNKIGNENLWKELWKDEETKLIHFIGKDNIVFHTLIWPAMLMGYGEYILPYDVPANEFLNFKDEKMSTSRNLAVWINDITEKYNPDFLRFYVTLIMPETKDSNFTFEDFKIRVESDLINNFGNLVNRTLSFIKKNYNGRIPERHILDDKDNEILRKIEETMKSVEKNIMSYRFRDALKEFIELSSTGNRYFDSSAPWKLIKEDRKKCDNVLNISCVLIDALSDIGEIFIPLGTGKVKEMLGRKKREWDRITEDLIKGGEVIGELKTLYEKFKDEKGVEMNKISIEDFKKLELKIGKIINVEDIEGANKLYKIEVEIGDERRTLVAGIKEHYKKEELIGKLIVVVANLEPAKIRGVESQGMLLAASDGEKISIISPDKDIKTGSIVK
uniref:Methionine--tRNA ligase n=1 Tax=candidate division WOR-3 bacterium TaxID=2052148 RepID=A0A7C4YFI8_UNCW3